MDSKHETKAHGEHRKKAHTGKFHQPEGRKMPHIKDAIKDNGKFDPATAEAHLDDVKKSIADGEYEIQGGNEGQVSSPEIIAALATLGVTAHTGQEFVAGVRMKMK